MNEVVFFLHASIYLKIQNMKISVALDTRWQLLRTIIVMLLTVPHLGNFVFKVVKLSSVLWNVELVNFRYGSLFRTYAKFIRSTSIKNSSA